MPSLTKSEIYLSKRSKVIVQPGTGETPSNVIATVQKNLEALGYIMSPKLCERLQTFTTEAFADWCKTTIAILKKQVGAHKRYRPMYPNFPAQVMEASESELFWNAMFHYFGSAISDGCNDPTFVILPRYEKAEREPLTPENSYNCKVIGLGSEEDFRGVFTALCASNSSLSESDKEILEWFVQNYKDEIRAFLPENVPQKETLALLVGHTLSYCSDTSFLTKLLKTATDVLRVACVMSKGDVSLAKPTRFRRMRRKERRFLLQCMEDAGALTEDMLRYAEPWKRLGRELRVGDYGKRFPKAMDAFYIVRNDRPFETYNSKVELCLAAGDVPQAVELLRQRPGVFARRLDHVLRLGGGMSAVEAFLSVADKVSTPVLVQVYNHFKHRNEGRDRAFFPKGSIAKMQVPDKPLLPIDASLCEATTRGIRGVLVKRFSKLPSLGSVWVDPLLKMQMVPFAMRSASKALRTIARGSRMPIPDGDTIRFFIWWKNGNDRTDIDLSAMQLGPEFQNMGAVAYYNLRNDAACHSGDITNAPNGACEFIDLCIDKMLMMNVRFVVMCINSYTQQPFCDLPECFGGWMIRSKPQSGEVFEARTVQDKVDVAANTQVAIPVIIDLLAREVIWVDMALANRNWINNVSRNSNNLTKLAKAMVGLNRPCLYDLFEMHGEARGTLVQRPEEAETKFSMHEGVTPYDIDKIMSEYLG